MGWKGAGHDNTSRCSDKKIKNGLENPDPSASLSSISIHRLEEARKTGRLDLSLNTICIGASIIGKNEYVAHICLSFFTATQKFQSESYMLN